MSHRFRKFLFVVLAFAGVVIAAFVLISTVWFRGLLEKRVIARIETLTGARVETREFSFSPFSFQLTFHGFVLHGLEPTTAPPLFSAGNLVVGVYPSALYRQEVPVKSIDWDNAEIHVQTNPDGSSNLPGPRISARDSNTLNSILNLSIGRVTFLHTHIFWNDQNLHFNLSARDVAFQLSADLLRHYQGSFSSSQTNLEGARWALPTAIVAAQFGFTRTDLTVDSMSWRSPGFEGNCSLKIRTSPTLQVNLNYSVTGDFQALVHTLRVRQAGAGKLGLQGLAVYDQNEWKIQGRAQGHQLVIPSASFNAGRIEVSADYSGDAHRIAVNNLKITALGGAAQGTGEIVLGGSAPAFVFRTQIRSLEMAQTLQTIPGLHTISGHLPPSASIQGKLTTTWKGQFQDFKSQFDLQFIPHSNRVAGSVPLTGHARGTVIGARGLRIDFQEANFHTPHSSITAVGTVGEVDSNLAVQLATSDFEEWRPVAEFLIKTAGHIPLELKSQATFVGTITGPLTSADIRGRIETGPFSFRGWAWDKFSGTVGATRSYLEISSGQLQRGSSTVVVDVSAHLNDWVLAPNAPAHLAARGEQLSIEGLQATLGMSYPVKGDLSAQINLDGTPANLSGTGQFQVSHGQIYQVPFDSLSAKLQVAGSLWTVSDVQLGKGSGRVTGLAQYNSQQRTFSVDFHGRDFSLADLKSISQDQQLGTQLQDFTGGVTSFDVRAHGTPGNVELSTIVDIRDSKVYGMPVGNLHAQLDWLGQKLQLQVATQGQGGGLSLAGTARTDGDWPVELSGEYKNFRADPWLRLLAGSKFNASVTATGTVSIKGPLKDPNRLVIESQASKLEINVADMAFSNGGPITIHYANHSLSALPFQMRGPSTNLQVEGSVQFGPPAVVSVTAHGESDNTLLSLLDPALHATGRSELNVSISGSPAQPQLQGTLKVHDLNLAYGEFPFHLSGLNGEIQLQGDRATAKSLRGLVGGGVATVSGFLSFAATPRFEIQAQLEQVRVQYPTDFTSLISGNLSLIGSTEGGQLEGDLSVDQMFASEDFNMMTLLGEVTGPADIVSIGAVPSLASKIRMNVRLTSDPTVRLDTNDLKLVADIDLDIEGTLETPVEIGTIHILSGEAVIRGNRYQLDRGDITMSNPFRTQPILDLQAQTRVQRYNLTMDISGPIDQVKLAYRSDPPLPTADIISLLALGYVRNTGVLAASNQSLSNMGATAILSQALSSQTTGRIQRLFGVSRIKIDPNVGDSSNISGTRVTIEQQISRDFTITYATNTGSTQQRVIQFEWALSDKVSLLGVRDQNGIFGMELIFRQRFK